MNRLCTVIIIVFILQNGWLLDNLEASKQDYLQYKKDLKQMQVSDREAFVKDEPILTIKEEAIDNKLAQEREILKQRAMNSQSVDFRKYPPSIPFYEAKEDIEKSEALKIFKRMPKGGNLHIHTSAIADIDKFIDIITNNANVYIYLGDDNGVYVNGQLFYLQYKPKNKDFKNLQEVLKNKELTIQDLQRYYTISNDTMKKTPYIWDGFNEIFDRTWSVLLARSIYKQYYTSAFETLIEDNIDYVELRFGPQELVDSNDLILNFEDRGNLPDGFSVNQGTREDSIKLIHAIYKDVQKFSPDFKLKLIIAKSKNGNADYILEQIKLVEKWRKDKDLFSKENFIVGFDLVGEEDRNNTTDYYAEIIKKNDVDVPLFFHAGETNWADNENLYSAYLLGTKRIGHGFSIYRYPQLLEKYKKKGICFEFCPISNQLLHYVTDLRLHSMGELLNRNIDFVICSDDPQIFGSTGLSYDFWEVYFSQDIDLRAIKKLIKNSYIYSNMSKQEKEKALENWQKKWNEFVEAMI